MKFRRLIPLIITCFITACSPYQSYSDTVTVNGQTLFYAAEGRGKPIILLHGNGGSQLPTTAPTSTTTPRWERSCWIS